MADLRFWFDPVCPFAWMTSRWVRLVQEQRSYDVEWRFISLRLLNATVDYDAQFPPEYAAGHTAGLRLLRVCARVREEHGPDAVARLYLALGEAVFETPRTGGWTGDDHRVDERGTPAFLEPVLRSVDLPEDLAAALDDDALDAVVQAETDEALALTGRDVGTPIMQVDPPDGVAFFGPVISRVPDADGAAQLWDHVVGLARYPGFAELKRSLRERPQLPGLGVAVDQVGTTEDWHGGSRRQHR
ncbi:mycothiol-dependent nitroreductase Rv2466c family protein [Nocardioides aurantiacus]|uniref:mycothiol-dependent nitroreductase Rv2466c family protein n=1 Tax=Nocardioides aurantiacus TaxID=86796 RepID=UPI00403FBF69